MKNIFYTLLFIFLSLQINSQSYIWAQAQGGRGPDYSRHSITDAQGNTYAMGLFQDTLMIPAQSPSLSFISAGNEDIYLFKYNAAGNFIWARQIGGPGDEFGSKLCFDNRGKILLCGSYKDTIDLDPANNFTLTAGNNQHGFLLKLDTNGLFLDAAEFSGKFVVINDVCASDDGYFLTGEYYGTVDLDPGTSAATFTADGFRDVLLVHLDTLMNHVWSERLGGSGLDRGYDIAEYQGQLFISGLFQGRMDFDPGPGFKEWYSVGQTDLFVLKLDTAGTYLTHGFMGGGNYALPYDLAISPTGQLWMTGVYGGTFDFDPQAGQHLVSTVGGEDMFLLRLSNMLNFEWMGSVSGVANENGRAIAITPDGRVFVTGLFEVGADLDPGDYEYNVPSLGMADIYILQLNRYGNFVCATTIGGAGADGGVGIGLDQNNNVYLSGFFSSNYSGNTDFDPGAATANLSSNGSWGDVFVASYAACLDFTGLAENAQDQNISMFPNPTNGKVAFKGPSYPAQVKVYDVNGKLVSNCALHEDGLFDLGNCPNGIYQLQLSDALQNYSLRLVKE